MKFPVRLALHNLVNNDVLLTHPNSTYKSGNVVQMNGATSQGLTGNSEKLKYQTRD